MSQCFLQSQMETIEKWQRLLQLQHYFPLLLFYTSTPPPPPPPFLLSNFHFCWMNFLSFICSHRLRFSARCFERSAIALGCLQQFSPSFRACPIFHRLTTVACPMFEWLLRREMRRARGQFAWYHSTIVPEYHSTSVP